MHPDFLFVYEHKVRELDSICLLKAELESRGYSVAVLQETDLCNFLRYRWTRRPKVIVVYALYSSGSYSVRVGPIVGNCRKIANLRWEQVFARENKRFLNSIPKGIAADAVHFCWSDSIKNVLVEHGAKHAFTTGPIHMDLLQDEFKPLYTSREEMDKAYGLPKGRMLLYISSYAFIDASDYELQEFQKRSGYSAIDRANTYRKSRTITLQWLERALEKDFDLFVVYRPHPGIVIDNELLALEKKLPRFHVINEGASRDWILAADTVVVSNSTAIIEAYFAKKNCIVLRPVPFGADISAVLFEGAQLTTTYEDFIDRALDHTEDYPFPLTKSSIEAFYQVEVGHHAYKNIADILESMLKTDEYDIQGPLPHSYFKARFKIRVKRIIKRRHITGSTWPFSKNKKAAAWLDYFWTLEQTRKNEIVDSDYVEVRTEQFAKILQGTNGSGQ